MIKVSKTYQVVTPESAEHGDYADQGFVYDSENFSFRDLVEEMSSFAHTSSYPPRDTDWVSTEGETDFRTGAETVYSLHYARENNPRALKYWEKAMRKNKLLP